MSGKITVKAQESGERIDALLSRCVEGLTRSAAQRLIEQGAVTLGGAPLKKSEKSRAGAEYDVVMPEIEAAGASARVCEVPIIGAGPGDRGRI